MLSHQGQRKVRAGGEVVVIGFVDEADFDFSILASIIKASRENCFVNSAIESEDGLGAVVGTGVGVGTTVVAVLLTVRSGSGSFPSRMARSEL